MNIVFIVLISVFCGAAISGVIFYLVFFSARKNEEALRMQYREDLRGLIERVERKLEVGKAQTGQ